MVPLLLTLSSASLSQDRTELRRIHPDTIDKLLEEAAEIKLQIQELFHIMLPDTKAISDTLRVSRAHFVHFMNFLRPVCCAACCATACTLKTLDRVSNKSGPLATPMCRDSAELWLCPAYCR